MTNLTPLADRMWLERLACSLFQVVKTRLGVLNSWSAGRQGSRSKSLDNPDNSLAKQSEFYWLTTPVLYRKMINPSSGSQQPQPVLAAHSGRPGVVPHFGPCLAMFSFLPGPQTRGTSARNSVRLTGDCSFCSWVAAGWYDKSLPARVFHFMRSVINKKFETCFNHHKRFWRHMWMLPFLGVDACYSGSPLGSRHLLGVASCNVGLGTIVQPSAVWLAYSAHDGCNLKKHSRYQSHPDNVDGQTGGEQ